MTSSWPLSLLAGVLLSVLLTAHVPQAQPSTTQDTPTVPPLPFTPIALKPWIRHTAQRHRPTEQATQTADRELRATSKLLGLPGIESDNAGIATHFFHYISQLFSFDGLAVRSKKSGEKHHSKPAGLSRLLSFPEKRNLYRSYTNPRDSNMRYPRKVNCWEKATCQDRCGLTRTLTTVVSMYPCHCDHQCWFYGDCCRDYYSACLQLNITDTSSAILRNTLANYTTYSQVLQLRADFRWSRVSTCVTLKPAIHGQMVTTCGNEAAVMAKFRALHRRLNDPQREGSTFFLGLSRPNIKQRCHKPRNATESQHPLDHTPATLINDDRVHFYNVFCAICNGVDPEEVSMWPTELTCNGSILNETELTSLFSQNVQEVLANHECTPKNTPPLLHNLRACFPSTVACSDPPTTSSLLESEDDYENHKDTENEEDSRDDNEGRDGNSSDGDNIQDMEGQTNLEHQKDEYDYIPSHMIGCCRNGDGINSRQCGRYLDPFIDTSSNTVYKNQACRACALGISTFDQTETLSDAMNCPACLCLKYDLAFGFGISESQTMPYPTRAYNFNTTPFRLVSPFTDGDMDMPSFRILFDFRSRETTVIVNTTTVTMETKKCPDGQVYVPYYDKCTPVTCVVGTYLVGQQCVPVDDCRSKNTTHHNAICEPELGPKSDGSYLPFPKGTTSVRLNIAFGFIFSETWEASVGSESELKTITGDNVHDDEETKEINPFMQDLNLNLRQFQDGAITNLTKRVESSTQQPVDASTLTSTDELDSLFDESALRSLWMAQMDKNDTATQKQIMIESLVRDVQKLLVCEIMVKLVKTTWMEEYIVCSNSTTQNCLKRKDDLPGIDLASCEIQSASEEPNELNNNNLLKDSDLFINADNTSTVCTNNTKLLSEGEGCEADSVTSLLHEDIPRYSHKQTGTNLNASAHSINIMSRRIEYSPLTPQAREEASYASLTKASASDSIILESTGQDTPPHLDNPCFVSETDSVDRQGQEKSNSATTCMSFLFNFRSSADLDDFIQIVQSAVHDLMTAAHNNNFLVSKVTITNRKVALHDDGGNHTHDNKITDDYQRCQQGETIEYKDAKIERDENGTYIAKLGMTSIPLRHFEFDLNIAVDELTSETQMTHAKVGWCVVDMSQLHCESSMTVSFPSSSFVVVNNTLVLTKLNENITFNNHLLEKVSGMTVKELVDSFAMTHSDEEIDFFEKGQYLLTRTGAVACSRYNTSFQVENISVTSTVVSVRLIPGSEVEKLASLIASIVSIVCLVITLFVYISTPALRNVPGKIVMSLSATLLLAQLLFLCCQLPKGFSCQIYAAFHHAAWLASFAWLAIMSVDLAYILNFQSRSHTDVSRSSSYKIFAVLGWGLPSLLAGSCFVLDQTNLVPIDYGINGVCWLGNLQSMLVAFGVPVFSILALTSACAIIVVRAIRQSSDFRRQNTFTHKKGRKQLILCVNLSLLMGLNWIFYFLAISVDVEILWTVHILINGSQGIYIALCYVARKSLLSKLKARWNQWRCSCSEKPGQSQTSPKNSEKTITTVATPRGSPVMTVKLTDLLTPQQNLPGKKTHEKSFLHPFSSLI